MNCFPFLLLRCIPATIAITWSHEYTTNYMELHRNGPTVLPSLQRETQINKQTVAHAPLPDSTVASGPSSGHIALIQPLLRAFYRAGERSPYRLEVHFLGLRFSFGFGLFRPSPFEEPSGSACATRVNQLEATDWKLQSDA